MSQEHLEDDVEPKLIKYEDLSDEVATKLLKEKYDKLTDGKGTAFDAYYQEQKSSIYHDNEYRINSTNLSRSNTPYHHQKTTGCLNNNNEDYKDKEEYKTAVNKLMKDFDEQSMGAMSEQYDVFKEYKTS